MRKTTFEKLGIPYEERDGIFYPVLVAGTEKADIEAGKYGRMWNKYIKEEYPMRYKSLARRGELEERADEVNDEDLRQVGRRQKGRLPYAAGHGREARLLPLNLIEPDIIRFQ